METPSITGSATTTSTIRPSNLDGYNISTAITGPNWSHPERIGEREYSDRIEFIYKQIKDPHITYTVYWPVPHEERVFKIIFSCVDGKWNKSEPIYGKIIPAQSIPERYEFDEEE